MGMTRKTAYDLQTCESRDVLLDSQKDRSKQAWIMCHVT